MNMVVARTDGDETPCVPSRNLEFYVIRCASEFRHFRARDVFTRPAPLTRSLFHRTKYDEVATASVVHQHGLSQLAPLPHHLLAADRTPPAEKADGSAGLRCVAEERHVLSV